MATETDKSATTTTETDKLIDKKDKKETDKESTTVDPPPAAPTSTIANKNGFTWDQFLKDLFIAAFLGVSVFYIYSTYVSPHPDVFGVSHDHSFNNLIVDGPEIAKVIQHVDSQTPRLGIELSGVESYSHDWVTGRIFAATVNGQFARIFPQNIIGQPIEGKASRVEILTETAKGGFLGHRVVKVERVYRPTLEKHVLTETVLACHTDYGLLELEFEFDEMTRDEIMAPKVKTLLNKVGGQEVAFCNSISFYHEGKTAVAENDGQQSKLESLVVLFTDASHLGMKELNKAFVHAHPSGRLIQFAYGKYLAEMERQAASSEPEEEISSFSHSIRRSAESFAKVISQNFQFANGIDHLFTDEDQKLSFFVVAESTGRKIWKLAFDVADGKFEFVSQQPFTAGQFIFDNLHRFPYNEPLFVNHTTYPQFKNVGETLIFAAVPSVANEYERMVMDAITPRWFLSILPEIVRDAVVRPLIASRQGHVAVYDLTGRLRNLVSLGSARGVSDAFPFGGQEKQEDGGVRQNLFVGSFLERPVQIATVAINQGNQKEE